MTIEKHHKIILGGLGSIVLILLITLGIFMYVLYLGFSNLNEKIINNQAETNSKLNELADSIIQTNELLNSELGTLTEEFNLLKATAGDDFSGIIEESIKSVVTIRTDSGQGTGFIITDNGYIVTNAHVLADDQGNLATGIVAITYGKTRLTAKFIGFNRQLDIALLKISGHYQRLELGDSNKVNVGEKVIAIGNPLGLQFSVSEGIISATHRPGVSGLNAYIQTDAALNPGNSGGPLINKLGQVIGINNFKISGGENLGFSLESNQIRKTINLIAEEILNQTLI